MLYTIPSFILIISVYFIILLILHSITYNHRVIQVYIFIILYFYRVKLHKDFGALLKIVKFGRVKWKSKNTNREVTIVTILKGYYCLCMILKRVAWSFIFNSHFWFLLFLRKSYWDVWKQIPGADEWWRMALVPLPTSKNIAWASRRSATATHKGKATITIAIEFMARVIRLIW